MDECLRHLCMPSVVKRRFAERESFTELEISAGQDERQ